MPPWLIQDIQSTLDIVTLHLREFRYKVQIFGVVYMDAPMAGIMLRLFEIRVNSI